jgi:hypothetical protein
LGACALVFFVKKGMSMRLILGVLFGGFSVFGLRVVKFVEKLF